MIEVDKARIRSANKKFRQLPSDLRNNIRKYERSEINPIWREEMQKKSGATALSARVFKTGNRAKAGGIVYLVAGGSNRKLSGGATPADLVRAAEFGTLRRDKYTRYTRVSPKGKRHPVTRRASRQLPQYRRGGYVVYNAAKPSQKRIASLKVQTIMRTIYDASEGR